MKEKYMRLLEQAYTLGEKMVNDESVEWDAFMKEVACMNEHLEVALMILKEAEKE